jgi:hypothetical protein
MRGGGGKGLTASKVRSGRRGEQRHGGFTAGVGRHGGEDGANKRGPVVRETRGRRPAREGVNRRGKRISREDVTDTRAGWADRAISACERRGPAVPAGPKAEWASKGSRAEIEEERFLN